MSNKKILNTLLMASLVFGLAGVLSLSNTFDNSSINYAPVVAEAKKEVIDAESFEDAVLLEDDDLVVSITSSTTTSNSQAYQTSFSSKITTYTTKERNVFIRIDDPNYTGQEESQPDETLRPIYNASVFAVLDVRQNSGDVIIPRTLTFGTKFILTVTSIGSEIVGDNSLDRVTSIIIPDSVVGIVDDAFSNLGDNAKNVTFKVMQTEEEANYDASVFPNDSTVVWGYVPTETEIKSMDTAISGSSRDFGTGKNFILGYNSGSEYYPLVVGYTVTKKDGSTEKRYLELPLSAPDKNNYDGVGEAIGSVSFNKNIDIELNAGETVNDEEIYFYNIFPAVQNDEGYYVPNTAEPYYSHGSCSYIRKDNLSNYITYKYDSLSTFAGFTSVCIDVNLVDGVYEVMKPTQYNANIANIESGQMYIRYRFTSFNLASYRITYENARGELTTITTPIVTPVDYHVLSKQEGNKVSFLLENRKVAPDFDASKIRGLDFVGLYVTLDLFIPSTNSIVTKSNFSSRFGILEVLPLTEEKVPVYNINFILIITMVVYALIYSGITIAYFLFAKRKYKNDEFRRVKPKQFFKTAGIGLGGLAIVILALMFIIFRFEAFNNAVVVYNPIDAYVIVFAVAAVITIGYYIKFFYTMIKTNLEKKKAIKLKLDEDVQDDGTK